MANTLKPDGVPGESYTTRNIECCLVVFAAAANGRAVAAMKVNGRSLPNNPKQAYMLGKLHGTQDTMGNVAMVLLDKCGWHIKEQTADAHDTMSISYLYECIVALAEEINDGRIKRKDIKQVLAEEHNVVFGD
jgi:hypothetical protein